MLSNLVGNWFVIFNNGFMVLFYNMAGWLLGCCLYFNIFLLYTRLNGFDALFLLCGETGFDDYGIQLISFDLECFRSLFFLMENTNQTAIWIENLKYALFV